MSCIFVVRWRIPLPDQGWISIHALISQNAARQWYAIEASAKISALWFDTLILPPNLPEDGETFETTARKDMRRVFKPYPKKLYSQIPGAAEIWNSGNFSDVHSSLYDAEQSEWDSVGRAVEEAAEEEWDEDVAFGEDGWSFGIKLPAAIPPAVGAFATDGIAAKFKTLVEEIFVALGPLFAINSESVPAFIVADKEVRFMGSLWGRTENAAIFELGQEFVLGYVDDADQLSWKDIFEIRKTHPPYELRTILEPCLVALRTGKDIEAVVSALHADVIEKRRKYLASLAASPYKTVFRSFVDIATGLVTGKATGVGLGLISTYRSLSKRRELMPITFSSTLEEIRAKQAAQKR